ncbi:MAG TPA: hypothetical protein VFT74_03985 [Isosphaeraceae bacterium]|nr:hypothetical protein [Isosphaeraceae bacterium]
MSRGHWTLLTIALAGVTVGTNSASAQLFGDLIREERDMQRLNRDEMRLQNDLNNGNLFGALGDLGRINYDEQRLQRDEARLQYDLSGRPVYSGYPGYQNNYGQPNYVNQTQTNPGLVPHPSYPGYYYYPSNPGQLYTLPGQQTAATTPSATTANLTTTTYTAPASNTTPTASASPSASNPTPPARRVSVSVINPDDYGVDLKFTADGKSYSLPSGYTQNLDLTSTSVIAFDRGSQFGNARYTVSNGSYEFKYTEHGWDLYKKPVSNPVPNTASNPVPSANPSPSNPVPTGTTDGLVPTRFSAPAPASAPAPVPPPGF